MKTSRSVPSCSGRTCRGPHVWVGIVALLIGTATLDSAHGQRKERHQKT